MLTQALVYGWYGKGVRNIGDLLFCKAFKHLFPNIEFVFTDRLSPTNVAEASLIIFGGGSFLYAPINGGEQVMDLLRQKTICYIGVGIETNTHPMHQQLMKHAALIAHRTPNGSVRLQGFVTSDTKVMEIPDLVYALMDEVTTSSEVMPNSVLVLPNAELLPRWGDINWKHASWNYFKSEFAQFLDILKESKYKVNFAPMCSMSGIHDLGAATEIINFMKHRNFDDQLADLPDNFTQLSQVLSKYEVIISQRYHGAILAHMCQRPCVAIAHHDKLKNITDACVTVPFYELSKQKMHDVFLSSKKAPVLPIKPNIFDSLRDQVYSLPGIKCPDSSAQKMVRFR